MLSPIYRKRYYSRKAIEKGDELTDANLIGIRSPKGIETKNFRKIIGGVARIKIPRHYPIEFEMVKHGNCES